METLFETKEYKSSRNAYTLQCMFEYFIAILSADAFLAKLLKNIGLSDSATGVISSLIMCTFLFQLISISLVGRLKRIKRSVIIIDTASQLLFACVFACAFLPFSATGKAVAVVTFILLGYLTLYMNNSICLKWGNSFVSPENRGSYSAIKEMVSLFGGMIFTLFAGWAVDYFENRNNLRGAFGFLSVTMVIVCVCNFICLFKMKEKPLPEQSASQSIKEIFNSTIKNREFRNVIILTSLTDIARYITIGFMGTYKTVDLGLSVSKIQVINLIASIFRFAISKPIGNYSDKTSFSNGFFIGNLLSFAAFFTGIFMSQKTAWLVLPFSILFQMSYAGTGQNTYNMAYCYVEDSHIMPAIAVNNSIKGTMSFGASFLGSIIVENVQARGNSLFGVGVNAQQILCGISAVITLVSFIFNKKVVSKQKEDKK